MYRGKKKFRYLNNPEAPKEHCIENFIGHGDYVVQMAEASGRNYLKFDSCESFFSWCEGIPEGKRTFSEVIMPGKQKFKIDIDTSVDDILDISKKVELILEELGMEGPSIMIFDIEKSFHIIISNYLFLSHVHCNQVAGIISKFVDMDMGVYKKIQHFRTEGSTKYGQRRWKRRICKPVDNDNFHEGVITDTKGTKVFRSHLESPCKRIFHEKGDFETPKGFLIRRREGNMILLDRKFPSFCSQCSRVHDKENAYMIGSKFFCRRKYF